LLQLDRDGAEVVRRALSPDAVQALKVALQAHDEGRPGQRLGNLMELRSWLGPESVAGQIARKRLGTHAAPVRALLFDKNATSNWALGWHQDRTIAVKARHEVEGFEHWNRKDGVDHVEPPFELIERMLTLRIHLDPVTQNNAPLLIALGTHCLGRIVEGDLNGVVERHGTYVCEADVGDIWIYRTAILHASKRANSPNRRRVLQVDFSADRLPPPLRWHVAA